MTENEELPSPNGAAFGCLATFPLFASIGFVLFFGLIWGGAHCEPMPRCRQENARHFLLMGLFLLFFVGALGLLVRQLAGWVFRHVARRSKAIAIVINLLLALLAAWLGFELAIRLIVAF